MCERGAGRWRRNPSSYPSSGDCDRAADSTRGVSFSWGDKQVPFDEAFHDFEVVRRVQREALEQIRPGMSHYDARCISDDSDMQMTNDE